MHYYKRNLGDYAKKAGRLSMLQHGAYTLLIDACYDREQFPTREAAIEWTWASSKEEVEAVDFVLKRFFSEKEGVFYQTRIQEEIGEYHDKSETNKRIATDREAKRKSLSTDRARVVNEPPPNHEPLTINHEPTSVPDGTGADAPAEKSPADMDRDELWSVAKSLLSAQGMPAKQCGSFVGKLVQQYTPEVVIEVVRSAVIERPVNVQEFLVGGCRSRLGGRGNKKSTMAGLLPPNSPRIPTAEEAPESWMFDAPEPAHV